MSGRRGAIAALLCALSLVAASCASTPPLETAKAQNPQETRIYVLREGQTLGEIERPGIDVDGHRIGLLAPARFFVIDRAPGQHVVAVASSGGGYYPLTVTTRAGSVHYLNLTSRPFIERYLSRGMIPQVIEQASTGHNGGYMLVEMNEAEGRGSCKS
jgi:hypothetical protein